MSHLDVRYAIVREAGDPAVREAASLHRASLPGTFLALLGTSFLTALYEELIGQRKAFLVAARSGPSLCGYILASVDSRDMLSVVARSPHRFAASVVLAILRRPLLLRNLVETLWYGRRTSGVTANAELIAIAVDPALRSQAIGRHLVWRLDQEFATAGVQRYKVTVHRSMIDADRFYRRNGFVLERSFDLYGITWNLYLRDVPRGEDVA